MAREEALAKLAARSQRRGCTCGRVLGHDDSCPMDRRWADERPYPWFDTGMAREDSE